MDLTAADVDRIEAVRQTVVELIELAEDEPDGPLDEQNLRILEAQLDALHQSLSLVVAQKDALREEDIGGE
jgi:hypothetical protein